MVNESILKLMDLLRDNEDLRAKLEEEADRPMTRGAAPERAGLGSSLLQTLAQSQGISLSQGDMSQLGGLLSEYGQLSGQTSSQQSFGFGQAAQQTAQQAAQPASDVQPLVMDGGSSSGSLFGNLFGGGSSQGSAQSSGFGYGQA